jgi:hypothetical protein
MEVQPMSRSSRRSPRTGSIVFLVLALAGAGPLALAVEDVGHRVKLETVPATNVVYLPMTGSYDQHPAALAKLFGYATKAYAVTGPLFGIYPVDPDSVGMPFATGQGSRPDTATPTDGPKPQPQKLEWGVAIRVVPGAPRNSPMARPGTDVFFINAEPKALLEPLQNFSRPEEPFKLLRLEETAALVLDSTVERTPQDGLMLWDWAIRTGYVQTAPTRMEYGMVKTDPLKTPTRILLPVLKRNSGLRLQP